MVSNMCTLQRLQCAFRQFETLLLRWTGLQSTNQHLGFVPALDGYSGSENLVDTGNSPSDKPSVLDELFGDHIMCMLAPKKRRSKERRLTHRFGAPFMKKFEMKSSQIVSCLECGSYHKRNTICGTCYDKVRQETKQLMAEMDEERWHNSHMKNLAIMDREENPRHKDEKDDDFVEVDKQKQWF